MAERMKWEHIINEDGTIVTTILERQSGTQCSKIKQLTSVIGQTLSDEQIGPECDDTHEIQL